MSGSKLLRALMARVRPATEDLHEVLDATFPYGRVVGSRAIPTGLLNGGIGGAADDIARVDELVAAMRSPEGYLRRLIVDDAGDVIEGQHRLDAVRQLELPKTPVHIIEDMSRGYDLSKMKDAVSGMRSGHQTPMIREALDAVRQYGSRATEELEMPSGYFSKYFQDAVRAAGEPSPDLPDIAPLRRFYAEGGYVDDTSHDIDDVDAGLYGSQYFAGGGAVTDEDYGAYVSQYYAEGGEVEPEGYANGGLIRKFLESVKAPLKAWHGTPHNVEKFDASKIGTGEGAQAYGHGLYFAENPEVAQWYRESLAGFPEIKRFDLGSMILGPHNGFDYSRNAGRSNYDNIHSSLAENVLIDQSALVAAPNKQEYVLSKLDDLINDYKDSWPEALADAQRLRANLSRPGAVNLRMGEQPGNMYEVGLRIPRESLLSWDSPLQSDSLKDASYDALTRSGIDRTLANYLVREKTGQDIYSTITKNEYDPLTGFSSAAGPIAADALLGAGIPGIRYRDGMSRAPVLPGFRTRPAKETENFVMFPGTEDLIEILGRYAEGGEVKPRGHFSSGRMESEPEGYANGGLIRKWLKVVGDTMRQPLGVAVQEDTIPKIIEDGRFKSLFETGTSGGSKNTQMRAETEWNMFGVPLDADPVTRPIYGHLFNPEAPNSIARQYGDWVSVLKPSVKDRATTTWGDSLMTRLSDNLGPYDFKQARPEIMRQRMRDSYTVRDAEEIARKAEEVPESFRDLVYSRAWPGYIEAQIHGGLPWDDVTALMGTNNRQVNRPLAELADRYGKPIFARGTDDNGFDLWHRAMPGQSRIDELGDVFDPSYIGYEYAEGGQVDEDDTPRGYFGGC